MNIANLLIRAARFFPERPGVFHGKSRFATFEALHGRAARLAFSLTSRLGLKPGERVALAMSNTPEFVEVLFACWYAGLVAVPMNPRLHPKELAYILNHSEARISFATTELYAALAPLTPGLQIIERLICVNDAEYRDLLGGQPNNLVECAPDAPAWLFYTSGTTGRPKGAELSHRCLLTMALGYFVDFEHISAEDSILHLGAMCHGSGLYIIPHIAAGAAQVVPMSKSFDAEEVFELIRFHRGIGFFAAPTMVKRLTEAQAVIEPDFTNLRSIIYGGGPMYVEDLKRAFRRFGRNKFAQVYGQGETPMAISVLPKAVHCDTEHPRYEERLQSVGIAQSIVEVRIADASDVTLPPGEPGEVLVRGDTLMNGYIKNPDATRETLRGGWLHTGDVGVMDTDGFISLKDRSKDVIISAGINIYPREVEEVLLKHPKVREVSVIGKPDAQWGELVVAFVASVNGESVSTDELNALCLENIARYKRPKIYCFIESLPKSYIGKILKTELRRLLENEQAPMQVMGRETE